MLNPSTLPFLYMSKKMIFIVVCSVMLITLAATFSAFMLWGDPASSGPYQSRLLKKIVTASENVGLSSTFSGSIGHFRVKQEVPNVRCVKKLSIFMNAINQTVGHRGAQLISITPCGPSVEVDGELAYSEVIVVIATPVTMSPLLLQPR